VTVGKKIKAYLKQKGISQTWLSLETYIDQSKLNLALNGHRRLDFKEYEYICYALNLPVGTFLEARKPEKRGKS
jgi:transcriptional regulator with XRE-family HTH domain